MKVLVRVQPVVRYTATFEAGPRGLRWLVGPVVRWLFNWQTRKRFCRMQAFPAQHRGEVEAWQQTTAL